jgi:1-acyl-sn-glycerol-3-phosphate acyltransferase
MRSERPHEFGRLGHAVYNLLYWPYLLATVVILFVPALVIWLATWWRRPKKLLHGYTSIWASHYLSAAPFAGVRVEGRENARGLRCVYVVNHQSMVDILAVYASRLPFLWVSKVENFYAPFLGWNMWLNGYVPLRRGHLPSIRRMLRRCERRLSEGASLCVFPEGTRSRDGNLKSFHRGAFWIAVRSRVPVVPIVVEGTFSILAKGSFGIRPRPVLLRVLEPIHPDAAGGDDRRLRDMVWDRMQTELAALRGDASVRAGAGELWYGEGAARDAKSPSAAKHARGSSLRPDVR